MPLWAWIFFYVLVFIMLYADLKMFGRGRLQSSTTTTQRRLSILTIPVCIAGFCIKNSYFGCKGKQKRVKRKRKAFFSSLFPVLSATGYKKIRGTDGCFAEKGLSSFQRCLNS